MLLLASICTLQAHKRSYNRQRVHTHTAFRAHYDIPARIQRVLYKHRFKRIDHYFPWKKSFDIGYIILLLPFVILMISGTIYVCWSDFFDNKEPGNRREAWFYLALFVFLGIGLILAMINNYYVSQHPGCILLTNNALLLMGPGEDEYTWFPYKHIKSVIDPYRTDDFVDALLSGSKTEMFWLKITPTKNARQGIKRISPGWIGGKNYETLKAYFKRLGLLVEFSQF